MPFLGEKICSDTVTIYDVESRNKFKDEVITTYINTPLLVQKIFPSEEKPSSRGDTIIGAGLEKFSLSNSSKSSQMTQSLHSFCR